MDNKTRLFRLAVQLADVEETLSTFTDANIIEQSYTIFAISQKKQLILSGAGAAVASILLFTTKGSGLMGILFGIAFVFAVQMLYVAFGGMKYAEKNVQEQRNIQMEKDRERDKRNAIKDELIRMQKEDPSLPQACWWNTDTDPENRRILPVEMNPDYEFSIGNELSLTNKKGKIYLEDYTKVPVIYTNAQMIEKVRSGRNSILYEDPELLACSKYVCYHLYLGEANPIEEISSKTETVINDKAAKMKEFQNKLDRQEVFWNALDDIGYRTDEEAYYSREISEEEYRFRSGMREWEVREKIRKLNEEPDSYDHTTYQKRFRGLYKCTFITCAYIFCVADGDNKGKTALIVSSGRLLPVLDLIFRAENKYNSSCGFVMDYADQEGIAIRENKAMIEFRDVIDYLFSEEIKNSLGLKDRNILLPKPEHMNEEQWSYLIWKDHPRKARS